MTMYHRGRARSAYRKRRKATQITHNSPGKVSVTLEPVQTSGSQLIKSVRALTLLTMSTNTGDGSQAVGWIGYCRTSNNDTLQSGEFDIANSEVFGVQPWVCGGHTDQVVYLPLKGITLSAGESWYLVSECLAIASSSAVVLRWDAVYAEHDVPA